jgi:RNA-binding protein 23/39
MDQNFPNLDDMDIEEFEKFIDKDKRKRSRTPMEVKKVSPRAIEVDDLEKRLEAAKRQAEEAQRDDCTVLVVKLHIKADEYDVYKFFANAGVGKVRDVKVIRDTKTGKSKGVAYVEFYTPDSVLKSMTLSGQMINGQAISVQPSQAEKNRVAAATRVARAAEQQLALPKEGPNKIFIASLKDELASIGFRELRQLFSSFGEIEHSEISKGVGYIQYRSSKDAREAVLKMDGVKIKGKRVKVGMADTKASIREAQKIGDHEDDGTYIRSKGQRNELMHKLAREPEGKFNESVSNMPTSSLLLTNLWDKNDVEINKNPNFFEDIHDDVLNEAQKFGKIEKIHIEKNSDNGNLWIKFYDVNDAKKAQVIMHHRHFGGRQIRAQFVTEATLKAHLT